MADQKLTELSTAGTLTGAELVYIVQGGVSKKTTLSSLMHRITWPVGHADIQLHISGTSSVVSAGTSSTDAWFSFDKSLYEVAVIDFIAIDQSAQSNHTVGRLTVIVDAPNYTTAHEIDETHVDGTNTISVPPADIVGNFAYLRFQRQSSSTATIKVRYSVDLWPRI